MSELPRGWATAKLSEIAIKIGSGSTPSGGQSAYVLEGIPLIRSMNVHFNGFKYDGLAYISDSQAKKLEAAEVKIGDVLLNITGASIGRVTIAPASLEGARVNQHVSIIRTSPHVQPEFISLFLSCPASQNLIASENYGATRQALTKGAIENFIIPIPPKSEQRRIVEKINALLANSSAAKVSLIHAHNLSDLYIKKLISSSYFDNEKRNNKKSEKITDSPQFFEIGQIANIITGSTPPSKSRETYFGNYIPFVKPSELDAGYYVISARESLSIEGCQISRRIPAGSTLLTCIGATIGKAGFSRVDCCTNQQINAIVPKKEIVDPRWLYWIVCSEEFQKKIIANSSSTTLPIINKGRLEKIQIPLLSLGKQKELISNIEEKIILIDRAMKQKIAAQSLIDRLEQSILAKAFRGELVPQDPNDEPASVLLDRIRAERAAAGPAPKRTRRPRTTAQA